MASSNDGSEKLTFKDKNELMNYISKNLSVDEIFEKLTQAEKESLKRKELISRVVTTVGLKNLLGEYFSVPANQTNNLSAEQNEAITIFLAEITSLMKTNSSVKHKVLDVLSEQHPKEFLSHALQENSTTRVCDEITVPKIANYLVHKVNVSDENEEEINLMQRSMLQKLIANTSCSERKIVADHEETQEMMKLLFKNKAKIDIFDDVHEFLRNLVQPD